MVTIVLNVSMCCQCNGCVKKVIKSILSFEDNCDKKKRVDPVKLREYIALKTKKKVELISPLPKKPEKETPKEKKVVKKQAPQVMSTVILKINLHCADCINKIEKCMTKYEGLDRDSFRVAKAKNIVTVKGTMDVTELTTYLKQKLKRDVHIVPAEEGDGGTREQREELLKYEHPRAGPRQRDGYGYENGYGPGNGYGVDHVRPYEMFSDENPNFCYIL
ncbi:hypothetical protein MKW98_002431 [Papaver atlanticum]|uniref:HMA domain-containing protein n=1 Tax=Papaver atlanticum TaxID=357466 RepID=A0AAD4SA52_9MAGN|nr:hypothetical protein MKW98_002431 [Papaver atlanticum]